ncbi:hypothetical protein CEK64_07440 [Xanthomonas sontii]|nr:hypothetical protein CEK64_07440 [Xanthomonas sontii]
MDMNTTYYTFERQAARLLLAAAVAWMLAGCGTVSQGIADDGASAQQLVWPVPEATNGLAAQGSFPTPEALALVHPGMDKAQVVLLLGAPHFGEGFAPREWNYLFHVRRPGGADFTTCQFKLLFGQDGKVGSQYWLPASCAPGAADTHVAVVPPPPPPAPASHAPDVPPKAQLQTLQADALFGFDGWRLQDLRAQGRQALDAFAAQLREGPWTQAVVQVRAYTDRLGSAAYNQKLSERRAATVAAYLAQRGIASARIQTRGMGAQAPVSVGCADSLPRDELIACLAPDRRVELDVRP